MRFLLLLTLFAPAVLAQSAPEVAPSDPAAHVVPFGQVGNTVELVLAAEASEPLEAEVVLVGRPDWVSVRPERLVVTAEPGDEAVAAFAFDVLAAAPAGAPGVLAFDIHLADGRTARHEVAVEAAAPTAFALLAPRPNPSRGRVVLPVALPVDGRLRVEAYDVLGRRVAVLHDGLAGSGGHTVAWETGRVAAGVYVIRAVATAEGRPTRSEVQRLTIVR